MSRVTYIEEDEEEKEIICNYEECRYKVNRRCYNNAEIETLGKKCKKDYGLKCRAFLKETVDE